MDVKIIKHTFLTFLTCLTMVGCVLHVDVKGKLTDALDSVVIGDSLLVYEEYFTSSGSECSGAFLDRWYGTNLDETDLEELIKDELSSGGWKKEGEFWYLNLIKDNTKIRLFVRLYFPQNIEPNRFSYNIPLNKLEEMQKFKMVYKFSARYVPEFSCGV